MAAILYNGRHTASAKTPMAVKNPEKVGIHWTSMRQTPRRCRLFGDGPRSVETQQRSPHRKRSLLAISYGRFKNGGFLLIPLALFCYLNLGGKSHKSELSFFVENARYLDALNATGCTLPEYDIYDRQIAKYINKPPNGVFCGRPQPYLTYMDWDGALHLNSTEVDAHNYTNMICSYFTVNCRRSNDLEVDYGEEIEITSFPLMIQSPVIRVVCSRERKVFYTMIHSHIKPLGSRRKDANRKIPPHRPSVLILALESMSRGNFIRSLPKTHDYLVNRMNMNVFEGLNKVADNTFPNMLALLSGFMPFQRHELPHVPVWSVKLNSTVKRNDDLPIIWKQFRESGYVTMYAEEYIQAIFNFMNVGFYNDPVDYYFRASYLGLMDIMKAINNFGTRRGDKSRWKYCVGNEPSYKYILNYTEEFLTEMAHFKYFSLSFFVEMSHEHLTDIKNMDADLLEFLTSMFDNGNFNNTVLFVMGDHGNRFDDIRKTFIGRIEERMPFLGILLPETLKKSHPHLQKGLDHHKTRLLSFYDIHETLVDLAEDHLGEEATKVRPHAIGKSILRPFDEKRTCTQIGILPEYCMCNRESPIPANSEKAKSSADIVINHINMLLDKSENFLKPGEIRRCARLTVTNITYAFMILRSFSMGEINPLIRVTIKVFPSNGLFEGAVEQRHGLAPQVIGDINRINKYGNQPDCISHDILRLYCYCV